MPCLKIEKDSPDRVGVNRHVTLPIRGARTLSTISTYIGGNGGPCPHSNQRQAAERHGASTTSRTSILDLPRDKLIVMTGLSGSGKSSLAFDTIYAEGQRRYVESLSAYARQFLEMMQKPDVDQIDGLSPAISIEQKTTSKNPRSTVGTVTEIYDYMRLLFARVGIPYSPATGLPIESQTVSQMVDRVMALPEGTRLYLLAPIVRGRKGEYKKELAELQKKGFQRVKVDGTFYEIADAPRSTRNTSTTSTWWSTASSCAATSRRGSPTPSRPR
jgi:excinuclease ABC subunit A